MKAKKYRLVLEIEDPELRRISLLLGRPAKRGITLVGVIPSHYVIRKKGGYVAYFGDRIRYYDSLEEAARDILSRWSRTADGITIRIIIELLKAINTGTAKAVLEEINEWL